MSEIRFLGCSRWLAGRMIGEIFSGDLDSWCGCLGILDSC